ncbi:hypothetical protein BDY24DRAFT_126422 [Mrakia frigida]|uniref:uncharacterized protein n=1 Tax=Mrakia frigida TaxID=29902 RepID=UPI003FCBFAB2
MISTAVYASFSTSLGPVVSKPQSMFVISIELTTSDETSYPQSTSKSLRRRVPLPPPPDDSLSTRRSLPPPPPKVHASPPPLLPSYLTPLSPPPTRRSIPTRSTHHFPRPPLPLLTNHTHIPTTTTLPPPPSTPRPTPLLRPQPQLRNDDPAAALSQEADGTDLSLERRTRRAEEAD